MGKVVHITKQKQSDFAYWKTKSVEERLNAIEFLRQQFPNYENLLCSRIQKVCKVITKTQD